jgi:hypothetical protein
MPVTLHTLIQSITLASHPRPFSIHVGFMKPTDIVSVADIPHFNSSTTEAQIATNVSTTPVKEWQRDPDTDRIAIISDVFRRSSEIMPNAVLLCENIHASPPNPTTVRSASVVSAPELFHITIPTTSASPNKPLWIIDGQHRVKGLAAAGATHSIPVVLLLNDQEQYTGNQVAKIFAQVTTGAKPLDELHNEWMSYAFNLGHYSHSTDGPTHSLAMETTLHLCRSPSLPGGIANPFYNQIRFNPSHLSVQPTFGGSVTHGFAFTCKDLQRLLHKAYFSNTPSPLPPQTAAEQVGMAVKALSTLIPHPLNSVFFGDPDHEQIIVTQAFLWGVMQLLRCHGPLPTINDWENQLKQLKFAAPTNWEFDWKTSLSGPFNTRSRDVVRQVFSTVFEHRALPHPTTDIPNYLRGGHAELTFRFSQLTPSGQASRRAGSWRDELVSPGYTGTISANAGALASPHVRLAARTVNVANVRITDKGATPGTIVDLSDWFESGFDLQELRPTGKLRLYVEIEFYGGTKKTADVDITW